MSSSRYSATRSRADRRPGRPRRDLPAEDDVRGTLRAHHRDLVGRPGVRQVGPDRAGIHHDVRAPVCLAQDHLDARDRGLAVGVQELGAMPDDAAVLLVHARQEAGDVDQGDQRDVERVARRTNRAAFSAALMSSTPAEPSGWLATIPAPCPPSAPARRRRYAPTAACTSKNSPSSTISSITVTHVVGLADSAGTMSSSAVGAPVSRVLGRRGRRELPVVGGQQPEQGPDLVRQLPRRRRRKPRPRRCWRARPRRPAPRG